MAVAFIGSDGLFELVGSENSEPIKASSFQKNLQNIGLKKILDMGRMSI